MGINIPNFLSSKSKNHKMIDFQDLDHLDGLSISTVSANLYKTNRDDLVMFYFFDLRLLNFLLYLLTLPLSNIFWVPPVQA